MMEIEKKNRILFETDEKARAFFKNRIRSMGYEEEINSVEDFDKAMKTIAYVLYVRFFCDEEGVDVSNGNDREG